MSGNYVINIGRQLGSGGKEIGEKLAARLGIDFYDKELINLASEESGLCKEIFEKAERLKKFISIDMADGDAQTDAMEQLIETYPDLRMAIGHFGMVTTDGWEKQIALAKHEHVYIESGGITWLFHKEFYPYPSAVRAIRTAIDICGIDKLMWGSDYPRTMTAITYDMSKDFIEKTTELSEEEKIKFLGENARAFYGFEELEVPEKIRNMVE